MRGLTAAQALNKSLDHSAQALRGSALVNQGLLGVDIHDLSRLVAGHAEGLRRAQRERGRAPGLRRELQPHHAGLRQPAGQPAAVGRAARPRAFSRRARRFTDLNASLPGINAWATAILPGVRETRPDDRRRLPVGRADAPARVAGRAAGPRERAASHRRQPRVGHRRVAEPDPAARPAQPLRDRRGPADRRHPDQRRLPGHRRAELQGGLAGDRRALAASPRTSTATASTRASRRAAAPSRSTPGPPRPGSSTATPRRRSSAPSPSAPPRRRPRRRTWRATRTRCPTSTTRRSGAGRENSHPQAPAGLPRDHLPDRGGRGRGQLRARERAALPALVGAVRRLELLQGQRRVLRPPRRSCPGRGRR